MKRKDWIETLKKKIDEKFWKKDSGLPQTYYLLLRGYPWVHDGDEFLGVYVDTEKLKQAYLSERTKLETLQAAGRYRSYVLEIYVFHESASDKEEGIRIIKPQELWGEMK